MNRGKGVRVILLAILLIVSLSLSLGLSRHISFAAITSDPHERVLTLGSDWIRSDVALGDLDNDGIDDIVVGSLDGVIYAYRGDGRQLWRYDSGDAVIEGKPAIGDIDGDGVFNEVVVGIGGTLTDKSAGGVIALSHDGKLLWRHKSGDFNKNGIPDGVYASPALADVDNNDGGKLEIIFGSYDAYVWVLNHDGSVVWKYFNRDTIWSSPAIGDIDRDGKLEVVIGTDSHEEAYFNTIDGGRLLVMNGEDGSMLDGFPISVDETIWSSPILADLTGDGWLDIIVGTGNCWTNPDCAVPRGNTHPVSEVLYGWDHTGAALPGWPVELSNFTMSAPSVADMDLDGALEVVINVEGGNIYILEADGTVKSGWPKLVTTPSAPGEVVHYGSTASTVLADLTGDGRPEIIVPSNWELVVFDNSGEQLTRDWFPCDKWELLTSYTVSSTPAIGDVDGDGYVDLIVGGSDDLGEHGAIFIWSFDTEYREETAPWPYFRRDAANCASLWPDPNLVVELPDRLTLMHEAGSSGEATYSFKIASTTPDYIEWQAELTSGFDANIIANSKVVNFEGETVTLEIDVSSLTARHTPYVMGTVTFTGQYDGRNVQNCPIEVTVEILVVDHIYRAFLPLTTGE